MTASTRSRRALLRLAVAVVAAATLVGCVDPQDRRPGFWLSGEVVEEEVDDWSFSEAFAEIAVETRTWYAIPHSVTTVCAARGEHLYVPSLYLEGGSFPDARLWNRNVVRDPRVRVRIGEQLYERRAVRVEESGEMGGVLEAFAAKYPFWKELLARPESERPAYVFFRMEPRSL